MESIERVMVVDGGGRGQAIAKKLASEKLEVVVSPGNPGNEDFAISSGVAPDDIPGQLEAAGHYGVDFTVVGAEDPLAMDIVGEFQKAGRAIFGPTKDKAQIESDKAFAKDFARRQPSIDVGASKEFIDKQEAYKYAVNRTWPLYVKNNAMAQARGVKRCFTPDEILEAIHSFPGKILIEDEVPGPELSLHTFCDGVNTLEIPFVVRDHKYRDENDEGPLTGGMGAVGPLPNYNRLEVKHLSEKFNRPLVEKGSFQGMAFAGLKGDKGEEKILEWNARWGDPEAQVFLRLMESDLLPVLVACTERGLDQLPPLLWGLGRSAVCLALASEGYPLYPQHGALIEGIEDAARLEGVEILQAGTAKIGTSLETAGGRVLYIVTAADDLSDAIKQANRAAKLITFDGEPPLMRRDIGKTVLEHS